MRESQEIRFKIPVSILVVIYTVEREVLLLHRADRADFWQSVTGSQNENETLVQTAQREVKEETGIDSFVGNLFDAKKTQRYEIYPYFRHRYAPHVTHNTEHWFYLELPQRMKVILSEEHTAYRWEAWPDAADTVFSPSNQEAIRAIPHFCVPHTGA